MRFAFSTDTLPETGRAALLREVYARSSLGCDIAPLGGAPLSVTMDAVLPAPEIEVSAAGGTYAPMQASRDHSHITGEGVLISASAGRFGLSVGGDDMIAAGGGTLTVTPMHRPSRWLYPEGQEVAAVWLGRAALADCAPGLDLDQMRMLPAGLPGLSLLMAYARALRDAPAEGVLGQLAARQMAELAGLVLGQGRPETAAFSVRAAHLAAIRRDMGLRFRDPDLTIAALAARRRISPRYLEMLFAETGATASATLLRLRLEAARQRLTDPSRRGERIATIAFACGFRELSTFNRAFRRRYGVAPGEMRAG